MADLEEFMRRLGAQTLLCAHPVQPTHQRQIEIGIAAVVVMHARTAFEQAGQDVVEIGDRIDIIQL